MFFPDIWRSAKLLDTGMASRPPWCCRRCRGAIRWPTWTAPLQPGPQFCVKESSWILGTAQRVKAARPWSVFLGLNLWDGCHGAHYGDIHWPNYHGHCLWPPAGLDWKGSFSPRTCLCLNFPVCGQGVWKRFNSSNVWYPLIMNTPKQP